MLAGLLLNLTRRTVGGTITGGDGRRHHVEHEYEYPKVLDEDNDLIETVMMFLQTRESDSWPR